MVYKGLSMAMAGKGLINLLALRGQSIYYMYCIVCLETCRSWSPGTQHLIVCGNNSSS